VAPKRRIKGPLEGQLSLIPQDFKTLSLRDLAEPGTVVVTARVQRQVAGLFVAEERGTHELKGVPEPISLFQVVRASGTRKRRATAHLPLVGREEELRQLEKRWQRARAGEGQPIWLVGEAGIGKSRLAAELHSRIAEQPHTWTEMACSQLLQNTPFHRSSALSREGVGAQSSRAVPLGRTAVDHTAGRSCSGRRARGAEPA
jgi:hypothetical protein